MSRTSAEVKNRYNAKAYDRVALFIPKGEREKLKQEAQARGMSLNGLINTAIQEYLK